jgi:hypothetical protein
MNKKPRLVSDPLEWIRGTNGITGKITVVNITANEGD